MSQIITDALFFVSFFAHAYNVFLYATTNAIDWLAVAVTFIALFAVVINANVLNFKKIEIVN